jgi:hypothetical protein
MPPLVWLVVPVRQGRQILGGAICVFLDQHEDAAVKRLVAKTPVQRLAERSFGLNARRPARSDATTYLVALLAGEAGLRCGEIKAIRVDRHRPEEAPTLRRPIRVERACDHAEGWTIAVRAAHAPPG